MRLVILGRDGVINEMPKHGVRRPDEWRSIPGSARAIARLSFARFHVVVATNQPGIGRGTLDSGTLGLVHLRMNQELAREGGRVDAIFYCPHTPEDGCACRKPQPGLLLDAGKRLGVELQGVPVIGDSLEDVQAAQAVGARPILVRTGFGRGTEQTCAEALQGVEVYDDLAAAVASLLIESEQKPD